MALQDLLPQVAGGGTLLVVGYGFHMFLEWVQQLRSGKLEEKKLELQEDTQHVTDAAAANAIMLSSLQALGRENERVSKDRDRLERQNAEKDIKIEELQDEVGKLRAQVMSLLARLDDVDFKLGDLRDNGG